MYSTFVDTRDGIPSPVCLPSKHMDRDIQKEQKEKERWWDNKSTSAPTSATAASSAVTASHARSGWEETPIQSSIQSQQSQKVLGNKDKSGSNPDAPSPKNMHSHRTSVRSKSFGGGNTIPDDVSSAGNADRDRSTASFLKASQTYSLVDESRENRDRSSAAVTNDYRLTSGIVPSSISQIGISASANSSGASNSSTTALSLSIPQADNAVHIARTTQRPQSRKLYLGSSKSDVSDQHTARLKAPKSAGAVTSNRTTSGTPKYMSRKYSLSGMAFSGEWETGDEGLIFFTFL